MADQVLTAHDFTAEHRLPLRSGGWARVVAETVCLAALAVLLGRATILHVVSPFGLAYFAVLTELLGKRRSIPAWFAVVGAFTSGGLAAASVLLVSCLLYRALRFVLFRNRVPDLHIAPFLAGAVDVATHLAAIGSVWTRYDVILSFADGALVCILGLIFFVSIPIFTGQENARSLRYDQLTSLAIFAGSVIMGLSGLQFHGVVAVNLAVDTVVLLLAASGGVGVGTAVAVVLGVLAMLTRSETLPMVGILAFSALLAGILKEGGKVWAGLGFAATFGLLSISTSTGWHAALWPVAAACLAAVVLFATPRRVLQHIATYVPGTAEHRKSEQDRVRRINTLLSEKIQDMGRVFEELSTTFSDTGDSPLLSAQNLLNHVVGSAANSVCQGCPRRQRCWDKEGYATYQAIVHTITKIESSPTIHTNPTHDLKERCIRIDPMMSVLRHNLEMTARDAKWIEKLREQRTLVSAQLAGVAGVIRGIAQEIERGNEHSLSGEEQVLAALQQLGLYVDHVHIVSLDPGKVEVEITQPSQGAYEVSHRVIAPLLSGIVGENITVSEVTSDDLGPCTSVFSSARLYDVKTAVATVAKEGRTVSGDTYASVDLGNGRYAVAVSDGMGNGERARRESKAAIELLKKLLKAGFDEQLAIKTVNSTLLLRSGDETFTTLDMALIDLFTARAAFLKVGSAPSFLKRGDQVITISGANVPIGILQDIEIQTIEDQLQGGDILILLSDGVYDAPLQVYDKEDWLRRQIQALQTSDPQEIADTLIESAARMTEGQIQDDMTVVVAAVSKYQPEWAAIKLPGVRGIRAQGEGGQRGA